MKYINSLLIIVMVFAIGCGAPTFDIDIELADDPSILLIVPGGGGDDISMENVIDADGFTVTVTTLEPNVDFSNLYIYASLEIACSIKPLDGAPIMGTYGDFSTPQKYRVTAASGATADWTIVFIDGYVANPIGCMADRWVGDVLVADNTWGDAYNSTAGTGVMVGDDCSRIDVTFDWWGYGTPNITLELKLEDIDKETWTGDVTMVSNGTYNGDYYFYEGAVGTYDLNKGEMYLEVEVYEDYGTSPYKWTITGLLD
jgi:hypothetical protein